MSPPPRPFTPSWLADDPVAVGFLPGGYRRSEARGEAVAKAAARRVHPAVLDSLVATTPAQRAHRDALARPGSAVVVTGQQAGLFGGPLYTLYKAAAAIVNARALQQETGTPVVPMFWLQNEDHDFAEIASCGILGTDGALHTVGVPVAGDERSIAARRLGPEVLEALDTVERLLSGLSEAPATLALLRRCYRPEVSPDRALRDLVETWFGPHGLLIVDPAALQDAALPVHHRAIEDAARISAALIARSEALGEAGFDVQVHVRPGAPLSFFHPEGLHGPRFRIDGDRRILGTDRPVSLDRGAFSTSALLRPILQDTWLPTAAYVGGPGEIAYFAQLPPLYACFDLPTPLIVPRARFRVVDETADRLLGQLGITADALAEPPDALLKRLGRAAGDVGGLEAALETMRGALDAFGPHAEALDKGLAKATEKTTATVSEAVGRLIDRYRRTLVQHDEVTVDRLDRLRARLHPENAPQERVHAWPWYGARFGDRFVEAVIAATVPFDGALRELRP